MANARSTACTNSPSMGKPTQDGSLIHEGTSRRSAMIGLSAVSVLATTAIAPVVAAAVEPIDPHTAWLKQKRDLDRQSDAIKAVAETKFPPEFYQLYWQADPLDDQSWDLGWKILEEPSHTVEGRAAKAEVVKRDLEIVWGDGENLAGFEGRLYRGFQELIEIAQGDLS